MKNFFGTSAKELEGEIDSYIDCVQTAGLIFNEAIQEYMRGDFEAFEKRTLEIGDVIKRADVLRKSIKHKLYTFMLIPDARGDVLGLIETLAGIIKLTKKTIINFSIEKPVIPDFVRDDFVQIGQYTLKAIDALAKSSTAYFCNSNDVNEHLNKVYFFENEVDKLEYQIKRKVFGSDQIEKFSRRVHIRYFAEKIALLSDAAESVGDRLSVYIIKRKI